MIQWSPHDNSHVIVRSSDELHLYTVSDGASGARGGEAAFNGAHSRSRHMRIENSVRAPPRPRPADFSVASKEDVSEEITCFDWSFNTAPATQFHVAFGNPAGSVFISECVTPIFFVKCFMSQHLCEPWPEPLPAPQDLPGCYSLRAACHSSTTSS